MRRLLLLTAALLPLAAPARAAPQCASPADQKAFEVLALRELMTVLVFKCNREADYNNNFIRRFQPALQENERDVTNFFRRAYGNAGQGRKDTFTTELVNVMSQAANAQGTEYCGRTGMMVNEMNALRSMDELAPYAAVKDIAPPGVSMCFAAATPKKRR